MGREIHLRDLHTWDSNAAVEVGLVTSIDSERTLTGRVGMKSKIAFPLT